MLARVSRMLDGWISAWVAALGLGASSPPVLPEAPRNDLPIRIDRAADDLCLSASELGREVESISGGRIRVAATSATSVRASTRPAASELVLDLAFSGEGVAEQRRLEVPDCPTARRVAALIIAVTLAPVDTSAALVVVDTAPEMNESDAPRPIISTVPQLEAPRHADTPPVGLPPAQAPEPEAPNDGADDRFVESTRSDRRARRGPRWRAAVWAGPLVNVLPRTSGIVGAEIGPRLGPVAVYLSGWHGFASERITAGVGARASVSGGGLSVALPLPVGPVEIELATGFVAGALTGSGVGERVRGRTASAPWAAWTLGAGFAWPAQGRFALLVRADAAVLLVQPAIGLNDNGTVETPFRAPPVGVRAVAGPAIRFP